MNRSRIELLTPLEILLDEGRSSFRHQHVHLTRLINPNKNAFIIWTMCLKEDFQPRLPFLQLAEAVYEYTLSRFLSSLSFAKYLLEVKISSARAGA